ncbi:MAG: hypothetical protein Q9169_008421 [Polycauliona sp. 2 TL-2023]
MVALPISNYQERLIGRRLVTSTSAFPRQYVHVFYNEPTPAEIVFTDTSSSPTLSALENLPAELRLYILKMVFEDIKPIDWLSAHHHAGATPASIIFTSKQMFLEAKPLALKACTFSYEDLPTHRRLFGPLNCIQQDYHKERFNAYFNEKHASPATRSEGHA